MTIASETNRNEYTGDAVEDTFPYEFKIWSKTEIAVYVDGELLTVDIEYTVTPIEDDMPAEDGGNVVFGEDYVPALGSPIVIMRALPYTQGLDLEEGGAVSAETLEERLDRSVALIQQLREALGRSIKFSVESAFKDVDMPDLQSSMFLKTNLAGDALTFVSDVPVTSDYEVPWYDVRSYDNLNAALSAIGAATTTLVVSDAQTLTANLTIPSTLKLLIQQGGSIDGDDTYTLTINGPFEAGPYQVFSGFTAGDVTFGNGTISEVLSAWWGDVGDDSTECSTAIQSAVNSLPLNSVTDPTALTPKGYATGGTVRILPGRHKVSTRIDLQRGIRVIGSGRESTQIILYTLDGGFKYVDAGGYVQDEIVFRDLSIWQDASVVPTSGAAIDCSTATYATPSMSLQVHNVFIEGTYYGINAKYMVAWGISNSKVSKCVSHGIYFDGTTSSTSGSIQNTYADLNGGDGFHFDIGGYLSFLSCASDSNTGHGWFFGQYVRTVTILGCGAEANTGSGFYLDRVYDATMQVYSLDNANGIYLADTGYINILGGQLSGTDGYGIAYSGTPDRIVVGAGVKFLQDYATNKWNAVYHLLDLSDPTFMSADGHWMFGGGNNPQTTSKLRVGGSMDSDSVTALKVDPTFTAAHATRNVAISAEGVTDDTAVTYPSVIGLHVPAIVKGAASTITETVGIYANEQTEGATAKVNVFIDTDTGTIPDGEWNIYSLSARPSLFSGIHYGANIYPKTDDTYYLGKNDDDTPLAWKGVIMKDTTNGKYYRLQIKNGAVEIIDLTD